MIKLYHATRTRSFRIVWLLEELGIPYEHLQARGRADPRRGGRRSRARAGDARRARERARGQGLPDRRILRRRRHDGLHAARGEAARRARRSVSKLATVSKASRSPTCVSESRGILT